MNTNWTQHAYFAALDWASDHHDVIVLDRQGAVQAEFRFAHAAAGWAEFTRQMQPFTGAPLTLETSSGPAVDQLLQRGWALYPIAPVAAARYRERKVPSDTKTDRHDPWAMADARRTDGHAWRPLRPQDGATATLRAFCRDESGLIEPRPAAFASGMAEQLKSGVALRLTPQSKKTSRRATILWDSTAKRAERRREGHFRRPSRPSQCFSRLLRVQQRFL